MELGWRLYTDGQLKEHGQEVEDALAARADGDFVWIRVADPRPQEIDRLTGAFDLPPLAVEDARHAHQRPKLERYDDMLFLVVKPAAYDDEAERVDLGEVHVFVGPGYAITIRHGPVGALDRVPERLEQHADLVRCGPAAVLHATLDDVVDAYTPVVRGLEADVSQIEEAVFHPDEEPPTERIYALMRQVLEFGRATRSLLDPLKALAAGGIAGVDDCLLEHFRDVADHAELAVERVQGFHAMLDGALQANVAIIGLQENRDQRKISAWAAIALVPTILGGIWGMNFESMPMQHWLLGFPAMIAIMAAVSGYLYWRLRRHDWL